MVLKNQVFLLYGSLTPGAVPPASSLTTNLSGVELAVNATDGKLFYKDNFGQVRLLASTVVAEAGVGNAQIVSGSIDGATIGATTPSTGNFTSLITTTLTIPSLVGMVKSNGNSGFSVGVPGVDYVSGAMVAAPLGVASLDATGKVPLSQLPNSSGGLQYLGTWNAATNTPTLVSGVGVNGNFYRVSVAGSTLLDGNSTWLVGDQVVFNGTAWERWAEATAPVQSVNGMIGAVVITRSSLSAAGSGANSDITSLSGLTSALSVSQGGTGKTTLSGIVKANGTAPFSAAVAGIDYALPTSGANTQLLANNGAGGFVNVTVGSGLTYSGGVLSSTGGSGSGTVSSVNVTGGSTGLTFSGGPITSFGTITMAGTLSVANGGTGATTVTGLLRGNGTFPISAAVANVDYALPPFGNNTQLLANNGSGGFANVTVGAGLSYSGGVLSSTGGGSGGGTVTSVNASGGTTGLSFTGGPVTTSGTLTLSGTLSVANGGTGTTTVSGILKGNGTSAIGTAVAGTDYALPTNGNAAQLLANNGAGGFSNVTIGSGLSYTGGILTSTATASIPDGSLTDVKIATNAAIQATKLSYSAGTGSVIRTVASKLGDFLSVKDFGAVGDGATNDSVAVAACISAAKTANKSVFWPDGSYSIPSLGVQTGRIFMWGLGNAVIKGTFQWSQDTFPSGSGAVTQTPTDPYFEAVGLSFQSTTSDFALKLIAAGQPQFVNTFNLLNCEFFGYGGLQVRNMVGFKIADCSFNNSVNGVFFEGCADGLVQQCFFKKQAGYSTFITYAPDHGTIVERSGGTLIRFMECSWVSCVHGIYARMHTGLSLETCSVRNCDRPLILEGCPSTRLIATSLSVGPASATLSAVPGYVAPAVQGVAMYCVPGGYSGGDMSVAVQALSCEFVNGVTPTSQPVVYANGFYNSTYPRSLDTMTFIDCRIQALVPHTATTLLGITNGTIARVLSNRFISQNQSTTMTNAWVGDTLSTEGYSNDFTYCTQSSAVLKSTYERTLTTTFITAVDPAAFARPGDIWVQP